jgi:hypothetical protein
MYERVERLRMWHQDEKENDKQDFNNSFVFLSLVFLDSSKHHKQSLPSALSFILY